MNNQDVNKDVSIFENIPEVTQPISFADNSIEKMPQRPIPKRNSVYLIMCGSEDTEYYTSEVPEINGDEIILYNTVRKGIIRETVLDDFVEEYYCNPCDNELSFSITKGVLMKRHFEDELPWLKRDMSEAQTVIKDKVIVKYNQIVPLMMNKMKTLEQQQQQFKQQQQQRQQQRQQRQQMQDDDLLEL